MTTPLPTTGSHFEHRPTKAATATSSQSLPFSSFSGKNRRTASTVVVGDTFGHWTVIGEIFRERKPSGNLRYLALMRCKCGVEKPVDADHAVFGRSTSCGCTLPEFSRALHTTHGRSKTVLFRVWRGMRERCEYPAHIAFGRYGARGISVCQEWQDFVCFATWAEANGWKQGLEIDRIHNTGNYCPGNCRIVTRTRNARNKTNNHILTIFGESKCVADWGDDPRCAVSYDTFRQRILNGWDHERALTSQSNSTLSCNLEVSQCK